MEIIKIIAEKVYQIVVPLLYLSYCIYLWRDLSNSQERVMFSFALILILRIENCLFVVRFFQ